MGFWMRLLYRVRVEGAERVPMEGAFILTANHFHSLDPVMLAIGIKRQLRIMAKKELFANRLFRFTLNRLGAFPVDRKVADMRSYKQAIELLESGHAILMFSQGSRMKTFESAKNGVALFSLKTNTVIVPAGISGNYKFRSLITVRFGEPISLEPYQGKKIKTDLVNELTAEIVANIKGLTE